MQNSITIYTRTSCPYCELVKKFFDLKQISYQTINMEENAEAMQKVIAMTGRSIAPTTVIRQADGSEEVVVGFNLAKIAPALV